MLRKWLATICTIGLLLVSTVLITSVSCAPVKIIADYDPQTDQGLTELYKKHLELFDLLENNLTKDQYSNTFEKYKEVKRNILTLKARTETIDKNSLTSTQIQIVYDNLDKLEQIHNKYGFHDKDLYNKTKDSILDSIKTMIKFEGSKLHITSTTK